MKKRRAFKEIAGSVPEPKQLLPETVLPHIFDTMWDCKTFEDLVHDRNKLTPKQLRMLREHGFDTNGL